MTNRDRLTALSEMKDYKVSAEDPDVRGWDVVAADGQQVGTVRDLMVDTSQMKAEYLAVSSLSGEDLLVPAASAQLDAAGRRVLLTNAAPGERADYTGGRSTTHYDRDDTRLTRAEEEVRVGKREVEAGEVVVGKHVETERVRQEVPVERERVRVERRPVTEHTAASAEIGDEQIRIPVREEELVIDKRGVVKEELVISKERVTDTETVETDVRRERFDVTGDPELLRDDITSPTRRRQ